MIITPKFIVMAGIVSFLVFFFGTGMVLFIRDHIRHRGVGNLVGMLLLGFVVAFIFQFFIHSPDPHSKLIIEYDNLYASNSHLAVHYAPIPESLSDALILQSYNYLPSSEPYVRRVYFTSDNSLDKQLRSEELIIPR